MRVQSIVLGLGMLAVGSASYAGQSLTCVRAITEGRDTGTESLAAITLPDGSLLYHAGEGYALLPNDRDALPYVDQWGNHTSREGPGLMIGAIVLKMSVTAETNTPSNISAEISDPAHGRSITNIYRLSENQTFHFAVDLTVPLENISFHYDCTAARGPTISAEAN